MFRRTSTAVLAIVIGAVCGLSGASALAQAAPETPPEAVPTPAPAASTATESYGRLEAGEDAHAMAERRRRQAIDRQRQTQEDIRYYHTWPGPWSRYYARRYALPYIRAYAPPAAAAEAEQAIRSGYVPAPPLGPWPMPRDYFGYPYVGEPYVDSVEQPLGHEKVWTGPNSYIYRPRYEEPTPAEHQPEAEPPPPGPAGAELPGEEPPVPPPSLNPPAEEPNLERVPGPREF